MKLKNKALYACAMALLLAACTGKRNENMNNNDSTRHGEMFMLVGTYTSDEGSKGIYVYKFNDEIGKTDSVSMVEVENPSFLTVSADERLVYAVGENDGEDGMVHAFSFDKTNGQLTLLNSQNTKGASPCYVEIHRSGETVITANYGGGSISVFKTEKNGALTPLKWLFEFLGSGIDTVRQEASHLHSVRFSPDGNFLFATDLGADKLYRYAVTGSVFEGQPLLIDEKNADISTPDGTGPRHFDFHPDGKYMYVLGELSGEIIVFDYDNGNLSKKQTVVADTVGARGSADIHVSPDGRFLYASNRLQADGIAIFSINQTDGTLAKVGYQPTARHPRNFAVTSNGKYLLCASRDDNKIQVFSIHPESGLLTDTQQDILLDKPVCIRFAEME